MVKITMSIALLATAMAAPTPMQNVDKHSQSIMGDLPEGHVQKKFGWASPDLACQTFSEELAGLSPNEYEERVRTICSAGTGDDGVCDRHDYYSYVHPCAACDFCDMCWCTGNGNEIMCTISGKRHCAAGVSCPFSGNHYLHGDWRMCR